jgi:hypothetical protein
MKAPSHGETFTELCESCNNSGRCPKCQGIGSFPAPDGERRAERRPCSVCHCTGRCGDCDGRHSLKESPDYNGPGV